jgi:hypothetical protein
MAEPKDTMDRIWQANVNAAFKAVVTEINLLKTQAAELSGLKGLEETVGELHRVIKHEPTREELRASFGRALESGGHVTRLEVAAWHGTTVRQVGRWMKAGLLVKLPGYGRKAMFDSRVACRLRPKRKEG